MGAIQYPPKMKGFQQYEKGNLSSLRLIVSCAHPGLGGSFSPYSSYRHSWIGPLGEFGMDSLVWGNRI
ncbi:MAG: hypothetical protein ACLQGU_11975 [bacterium]